MTRMQIIRKLWSAVYDLLLYIQKDDDRKPLDEIQDNLVLIEEACRKYTDTDDEEEFLVEIRARP